MGKSMLFIGFAGANHDDQQINADCHDLSVVC